jgi:trans-aconitate methyltransferase
MTHTAEYAEQLKKLHEANKKWGVTVEIPKKVIWCIENFPIKSVLDFGCGKGAVIAAIKEKYPHLEIYGYDPAFNNNLPEKVDMIMSTDVLEHIEPEELTNTLNDLASRTNILQYHLIACYKAKKELPDGRNAHLIIKTPDWWQRKLGEWNWEFLHEDIVAYMKYSKKQSDSRPMAVIKYETIFKV